MYNKQMANIITPWGKAELLPGKRQGYPLELLLFNVVLETTGTVIRQDKEVKGIRIEKEELKLFLFEGDISYI